MRAFAVWCEGAYFSNLSITANRNHTSYIRAVLETFPDAWSTNTQLADVPYAQMAHKVLLLPLSTPFASLQHQLKRNCKLQQPNMFPLQHNCCYAEVASQDKKLCSSSHLCHFSVAMYIALVLVVTVKSFTFQYVFSSHRRLEKNGSGYREIEE